MPMKSGMTVKDLKRALKDVDDDLPVHLAYNYGDHWRTIVAPGVKKTEEDQVVWSEYHRMYKTIDPEHERPEEDEDDPESKLVNAFIIVSQGA